MRTVGTKNKWMDSVVYSYNSISFIDFENIRDNIKNTYKIKILENLFNARWMKFKN